MRRPPELGAIAPIHWSHDRYTTDVHYVGGALHCADSVEWPAEMVAEMALPPLERIVGAAAMERMWRERMEETSPWPLQWLQHQRRDTYWRHGSLCEDWDAIEVPVLAIGGWLDGYRDACLALLRHGRMPRRVVIGPWGHARPHRGWPAPAWEHRLELARWFGRWLRGDANGVEADPMFVAYVAEGQPRTPYPEQVHGRWRAWRQWPPDQEASRRLYLTPDGLRLEPADAEVTWTWSGPQSVGASAPWWCTGSPPSSGPADMRPDDAASLTWDTEPLVEPLDLLGHCRVSATVISDQPVALLAARLEEVHEDGYSSLIARGVLNLTHRRSHERPEPLVPGRPETVELTLMGCGARVPAGRRLRLALAGADWPNAWPPPRRCQLAVRSGREWPSTLELPLADPADEVAPPAMREPVALPEAGYAERAPVRAAWVVAREHMTGTTTIEATDGWDTTLPDGGRTLGTRRLVLRVADEEPTSCHAEQESVAEVEHDGLVARAEARLAVQGGLEHWHVEIDLRVLRDGRPFWERSWRERFPRELC
jgi:putative CocE/NonD family hydrolase